METNILGNLNFLAHGRRSNKLRRIKVVQTETTHDSDISSLDSNSDSLKSEDVFAGNPNPLDEDDLDITNESRYYFYYIFIFVSYEIMFYLAV